MLDNPGDFKARSRRKDPLPAPAAAVAPDAAAARSRTAGGDECAAAAAIRPSSAIDVAVAGSPAAGRSEGAPDRMRLAMARRRPRATASTSRPRACFRQHLARRLRPRASSAGSRAKSLRSSSPDALPDPDMKVDRLAAVVGRRLRETESGESVAPKGEVNTDNQQRQDAGRAARPADEKSRAKSEKCLAEAVYFEARGEAVRGQIAVAQVVMNRAFSGYYPTTVCGVVFQNKYRHTRLPIHLRLRRQSPTSSASPTCGSARKKIAKAMLDGQIWLPEVGKSTHYHAYYVHPSWVAEMKKMYKFGVHTFYRPQGLGRRQRRAELGHAAADRGDFRGARGRGQERGRAQSELGAAVATGDDRFVAKSSVSPRHPEEAAKRPSRRRRAGGAVAHPSRLAGARASG